MSTSNTVSRSTDGSTDRTDRQRFNSAETAAREGKMKIERIQTNPSVYNLKSAEKIKSEHKSTVISDAVTFEGEKRENSNQEEHSPEKEEKHEASLAQAKDQTTVKPESSSVNIVV
ncbi:MAG: hypothetical protein D6719_03510 [Candidatus Dadabacteria bacterium]|nr:MAG: hypothetical protein D6719_03510 [Candidatus Dadabacteria bacterium]